MSQNWRKSSNKRNLSWRQPSPRSQFQYWLDEQKIVSCVDSKPPNTDPSHASPTQVPHRDQSRTPQWPPRPSMSWISQDLFRWMQVWPHRQRWFHTCPNSSCLLVQGHIWPHCCDKFKQHWWPTVYEHLLYTCSCTTATWHTLPGYVCLFQLFFSTCIMIMYEQTLIHSNPLLYRKHSERYHFD